MNGSARYRQDAGRPVRCVVGGAVLSGDPVVLGTLTLPGVPRSVGYARRFLRDLLPPGHPVLDDLMTVGSETVSNAIAHTASGEGGWVTVSLLGGAGFCTLEVGDDGAGGGRPHVEAESGDENGRGLRIVEALTESWGFGRTETAPSCGRDSARRADSDRKHRQGVVATLPDAGARSVRERRTMSVPAYNTVAWFQVGTEAPEEARRFYGDLFGWRIEVDPDGDGYDMISYPGAARRSGGISYEDDASGRHAMFLVMVEDVDAVCAETERHGGKVALPTVTASTGLKFAYLEDPAGNTFGVFSPAAG